MKDWPNHNEAWREWHQALTGARMHHGWILTGKSGLGKHEFALRAARELVCEEGAAATPADHPDIITLTHLPKDEKEEKKRSEGKPYLVKRNIAVDQVRAMQKKLTTRPTLGVRRAIIINPADDMEPSASNALLKSLEEPPQGTFFLLVAHSLSRLLPTIRSRCRVVRFPVLSDSQLTEMLEKYSQVPDSNTRDAVYQASGGSFGAALSFVEQDLSSLSFVVERLLDNNDSNFRLRGELAMVIGPRADRARIQAVLELSQAIIAKRVRSTEEADLRLRLINIHCELVALSRQAPTYNFDTGLLVMELGTLLSSASKASAKAYG